MASATRAGSDRAGRIWVMTALLAASIEPIIVKFGYRGAVTPMQLFALKTIFAAFLCLPVMMLKSRSGLDLKIAKKLTGVSVLLMMTNLFTLYALKYISAVTVITVVTTTPALVALSNQKLGRERLEKYFWPGFWLCFGGVVLSVHLAEFVASPVGLASMFAAVVTSTIYRVRMEDLTAEHSAVTVSAYTFLFGALATVLFVMPFNLPIPSDAWLPGVWIGIAAGFANIAFLVALNLIGSTRISIIAMLQRPLLIVAAALILKEPVSIIQTLGIVMVFLGTHFARVKRIQRPQPSEAS